MQWVNIEPTGPKIEGRYRMASAQYEDGGVNYFAIFGGQTATEKKGDLYM